MPPRVWTSTLLYSGPDRVDIAPGSRSRLGAPFAIRSGETPRAYQNRISLLDNDPWLRVASLDEITFCCSCPNPSLCHRTTLVQGFHDALGTESMGERALRLYPTFRCTVRGCGLGLAETQGLCPRHWDKLGAPLQRRLAASYRDGQRHDGLFSREWSVAMKEALAILNGDDDSGEHVEVELVGEGG